MKQLIYILILVSSTSTSILAQPLADNKRDYIWLFGMRNQLYNAGDTSYGGAYMDFKTNPPLLYKQPKGMNFSITSSSLADSLGNLWAYTNGISIADRTHQTMMNGDSIGWTDDVWDYYHDRGMTKERLPIFILRKRLAYIINPIALGGQMGVPGTGYGKFEYSIIDVDFNNSRGRVINKNIQPLSDSITTTPGTCRHSNGLDWWLIQSSKENKYNIFLIDSSGLNLNHISTFNASNLQNGQSFFSPNGEHYIVVDYHTWLIQDNPDTKFLIYDFDRCTGQLSNEKIIYSPGGLLFLGAEASPNSKYLYLNSFNYVLQYDITLPTATEIAASVDTVAVYDGFKHLEQYETKFFLPQNAPDGKIYMSTWYGKNRYMHVIEDPNERGMACHVRQHELWLPSWSEMTMPNFPNYRLGAIDGSACDTLGIDQQTFPLLRLKPYKVNFGEVEIGETYSRTIKAYNLGTGTVLPTTFTTQTGDYSLTLPTAMPVGDSTTLTLTYTPSAASIGAKDTLRIESNSQIPTNLIFAWADVNTATEDIDNNAPSILVYPNPVQESITLSYELAQDGEAELVNSLGQVLATHALQAGYHKTWFSVANMPNGAYFIRVSTSAGVQISKQVFVLH